MRPSVSRSFHSACFRVEQGALSHRARTQVTLAEAGPEVSPGTRVTLAEVGHAC